MIRLRVKEIAQAKGLSQGKLSRLADLEIKTVRRILQNPGEIITTETLDKLCKALNVDVSLLVESDPPLPKTLEESLQASKDDA